MLTFHVEWAEQRDDGTEVQHVKEFNTDRAGAMAYARRMSYRHKTVAYMLATDERGSGREFTLENVGVINYSDGRRDFSDGRTV